METSEVYHHAADCLRMLGTLRMAADAVALVADVDQVAAGMRSFHNSTFGPSGTTIGPEVSDPEPKVAAVRESRRTAVESMAFHVAMLAHAHERFAGALAEKPAAACIFHPTDPPRILPGLYAVSYAGGIHVLCERVLSRVVDGVADRPALAARYAKDVQLGLPGVDGLDGGVVPCGVVMARHILDELGGFDQSALEAALEIEQRRVAELPPAVDSTGTGPPPVSVSPDLVAGLEALVAKGMQALGARDDDHAPAAKLPELKAHDKQAWQLASLHGMTQEKVAAALNTEHGTTYTQGQVSRMIDRAMRHADANGLAEKMPKRIARPLTVDPARTELGARTDKRKPRPSDLARADDDDQ